MFCRLGRDWVTAIPVNGPYLDEIDPNLPSILRLLSSFWSNFYYEPDLLSFGAGVAKIGVDCSSFLLDRELSMGLYSNYKSFV